jgi:uncharacterized membrane protein
MIELLEGARILIASVFVLFLPGFSLSFALFPKKDEIDWIERIALSFGLSIAIIPLLVFYSNFLFGIKINLITIASIVILTIFAGYFAYFKRKNQAFRSALPQKITKKHLDKQNIYSKANYGG